MSGAGRPPGRASAAGRDRGEERAAPAGHTLAVAAADADLSKAQAQKLAGTVHDGIARGGCIC
ncbi:P1 family peptidase [Streptomyces bobili]|uniref:P1 family peptidase n=1 Tax=Streptomyces bobili TaxID=67280 RepID=UPI0036DFBB56